MGKRGRYGMSLGLHQLQLSFFTGLCLGEICHIVEIAIKKKLLLYENNMLLPARACDSLINATEGRPTPTQGHSTEGDYIETIGDLKSCIVELFKSHPEGFNLSTLKTKMKHHFNKRLSETVFHQTKLLDLVRNPPMDSVVDVQKLAENCGYLCVPIRSSTSSREN